MKRYLLLLLLFFGTIKIIAQTRIQFFPKEEKITDTSLQKFIDTLKAIVKRKDVKKIYTLLDAKIVNSPTNSDEGVRYFKKCWQPEKKNDLWKTLEWLLAQGGQYDCIDTIENKNSFVFPHFLYEEVKNGENSIEYFVVLGNNINMHKEANSKSESITRLSYEAVTIVYDSIKKNIPLDWEYVQTLDNAYKGFIKRSYLYNFFDYHLHLNKRKDGWKIMALTQGS